MTEIDFDELDRAVNSLMAPKDAKAPAATEEEAPTNAAPANDTSNATEVEAPSVTATDSKSDDTDAVAESDTTPNTDTVDDSSTVADDTPVEKSGAAVITRSRGKFMDVIRPSASAAGTAAASEPSRQAPAPVRSRPTLAPSASFEKAMAQADETTEDDAADSTELPQSPFIADAKVDKRPLGNASSTDSVAESSAPLAVTPDTKLTPVPDELQSDILNVESGGIAEEESTDAAPQTSGNNDKKDDSKASASIAPQYKVEESKLPEEHTPLYSPATTVDTAKSAGKHSPWKVIIFIVVLLVVGVLCGLAAYTMHLFR